MGNPVNHFAAKETCYEFGSFRLDPAERVLLKDGQPVQLTPKVFETLLLLVERRGRVAEKSELLRALWPDVVVEEINLAHNISRLRKALGEEAAGEKFIETVSKRGYRFVAEVKVAGRDEAVLLEKVTVAEALTEEEIIRLPDAPRLRNTAPAGRLQRLAWPLALLLAGWLGWLGWQRHAAGDGPVFRTIAVLPLENLSPPGAGETLGASFADVLTTRLSGLRGITVRPLNSVLKYEKSRPDDKAIGRELQVGALLTGSVQCVGERLRLTLRLVNVSEQRTLWTGQFDEKLADLLVVQDAVADKVTEALALNLTPAEKQALDRRFTQDADAQHLYEKGNFLLQRQRYLDQAAAYLRLALVKDPNFALAYCRLGEVQTHQTSPAMPGTRELLDRALKLDPELAEGWAALGLFQMFQQWDWAAAEKSLRRALELKPGYAKAHQWWAEWLAIHRRLPEAIAEMETALAIDPTAPNLLTDLGKFYVYARDYERALTLCRQALALDPEFFVAHTHLSNIYWRKGQEREAFEYYQQWRRLEIRSAFHADYDGTDDRALFAQQGFRGVLAAKRSDPRAANEPAMAGYVALECANLGDREQALYWIERATRNHKGGFAMPYLAVDPIFDDLRDDARFQAAVRQVGLAGQ